jgi:hypothetical protein
MRQRLLNILLMGLLLIAASNAYPVSAKIPTSPALTKIIFDDALAPGWDNWSWAQVNLTNTTPVHSGANSIAVTFGAWQGLYLHKAGADSLGTTHLRFFVHGGTAGGQQLNVFMNLEVSGQNQNGPSVAIPAPPANNWAEVDIPLSQLNPSGATITGITWQSASGSSQPKMYFDDIALVSTESPDGPQLSQGYLFPRSAPADGITTILSRVKVTDPQGLGDIASVRLDAGTLGRESILLKDDGRSNDGQAGDGTFGTALTIAPGTPTGEGMLLLTAQDKAGHTTNLPLGAITILGQQGGAFPEPLPQRIGWGSNAWSENPGQDWQVNSGVPWDYVYQYITYGWESWGGSFVQRFVNQAWNKHFIPMVTVYLILGTPPDCGEGGSCYAQKLKNASAVKAYLDSLKRAAQEAAGAKPVIFNIEPDFYGYMQQLSNDASRPAGVQPNDPSSYPVALNISGYADTLAGFGRYLVDIIHTTAPNALVAPMASMWATNGDPQSVTDGEAIEMSKETAAFIDAMGGAQADLLIAEWSDRDAGSGLRPWWDDSDQETPRPTRAILWENALSQAANKRLLLWQIPVGNMSLDNTCDHYRDNRAAYLFSHPRDLVDAGVMGVLFGGGASCMTSVATDGGFVAAQGAIAYADPPAPTGLTAGSPGNGIVVPLHWDEVTAPDLWGYQIEYKLSPGGNPYLLDAHRANAVDLLLPKAGTWEIRVIAYDAMGNVSAPSSTVTVTTNTDAQQVYLPILHR